MKKDLDCMLPIDPDARVLKFYSVQRGVQAVIRVDGCSDILEVVNPTDGRLPFFRLREIDRTSEAIELTRDYEEVDDDEL